MTKNGPASRSLQFMQRPTLGVSNLDRFFHVEAVLR